MQLKKHNLYEADNTKWHGSSQIKKAKSHMTITQTHTSSSGILSAGTPPSKMEKERLLLCDVRLAEVRRDTSHHERSWPIGPS